MGFGAAGFEIAAETPATGAHAGLDDGPSDRHPAVLDGGLHGQCERAGRRLNQKRDGEQMDASPEKKFQMGFEHGRRPQLIEIIRAKMTIFEATTYRQGCWKDKAESILR
jgi:hypothetical protein